MKKISTQVLLLILIAVVISMQIMREIQMIQMISEAGVVSLPPFVWQPTPSCWTATRSVHLKIPDCERVAEGAVLLVTGTQAPESDSWFFSQKRMIVDSYTTIVPPKTSLLYWQAQSVYQAAVLRTWILAPVRQTVSYPEEALVESFVLGSAVVLPESIKHSIKIMGIAHVIAVSGSHLTLLIGALVTIIKSNKRLLNTFIIIFLLIVYTTLVGWQPAVTRALLMSVIMLVGKTILHRQVSFARSLIVSSLMMVTLNPWVVFNIGWQLSVFATAGICWIYPLLQQRILPQESIRESALCAQTPFAQTAVLLEEAIPSVRSRCLAWIKTVGRLSLEATLASIAALAMIWPIMLSNFGTWSWGSILSSLLLWWLFPLVIGSCFVGVIVIRALAVVSVHPAILQICSSLLLEWPVRSVTWLFERVNSLEWMVVAVEGWPPLVYISWYVLLLLGLMVYLYGQANRSKREVAVLSPLQYQWRAGR